MLIFLATLFFLPPVSAQEVQGELRAEAREFEKPRPAGRLSGNHSMFGRIDATHEGEHWRVHARGSIRVDANDPERTFVNPEDINVRWDQADWSFKAGTFLYNNSVMEAFHPNDGLNARNFDSDLKNPEKIGEQTLSIGWKGFTAYLFPSAQAPRLPSARSRFGAGVRLSSKNVGAHGASNSHHPAQYGASWKGEVLGGDLTLTYSRRMDRAQPLASYNATNDRVDLFFFERQEAGYAFQKTLGSWILKTEGSYRKPTSGTAPVLNTQTFQTKQVKQPEHGLFALGTEYVWVRPNGGETSFLAEAQAMTGMSKADRELWETFQRDAMLGFRHALNDVNGHEFYATWVQDLERRQEWMAMAGAERRLGDSWKAELGIRVFQSQSPQTLKVNGLSLLRRADHILMNFSRFF